MEDSGRGAAWLARLLGVQEVPSSNLGGPTKFLKDLQKADRPQVCLWSPTGVQTEDSGALVFTHFVRPNFRPPNAPGLSPPIKTRQTRHLALNLLIRQAKLLSGGLENPTNN